MPSIPPLNLPPRALGATLSALVLSAASHGVHAQAAAPTPDAPAADDAQRIEITANKRREKQREAASTVSVLQGDALEAAGATGMEDMFRRTPGVQTNKGEPDQSVPTIRGIGTVVGASGFGLQQATTGVYIEDVPVTDPVGFLAATDLAPFDLERVEVLRGPQGVLYGSSSLGGAVRYVVRKPDTRDTAFSVLGTAAGVTDGTLDRSLRAMLNLPLGGSGLRMVAFDRQDSGTLRNAGTGRDHANALHQQGGRVTGVAPLGDRLKATAMLMTQRTDVDDASGVPDPSRRELDTPTASPRRSDVTLANLQFELDLGSMVLTSNTGRLDKTVRARPDQTARTGDLGQLLGLPLLPVVIGHTAIDSHATSQELRVASAGAGPLNVVAGAFYQRTDFDSDIRLDAPGGALLWGEALLPGDHYYSERDRSVATEQALFADGELALAPGWTASLGGRWYRNHSRFDADSRLLEALLGPVIVSTDRVEDGWTPRASLKHAFGDHVWYALVSKGYRFGGVNPASGTTYRSDALWNYETGLRLNPSRRLSLDASVFVLDWRDAQVNARQPGEVPVNGIANVGRAQVDGVELSAQWRPMAGASLAASLAWTDARTTRAFVSSNGSVVPAGARMPGTPRLQSSLQYSQRFEGPWGTAARWDLSHAYMGERVLSLDSGGRAGAYQQWDTGLAFARDGWELSLFVRNLADAHGVSGGAPNATFGGGSYTEYYLIRPRTAGLSLRYDL